MSYAPPNPSGSPKALSGQEVATRHRWVFSRWWVHRSRAGNGWYGGCLASTRCTGRYPGYGGASGGLRRASRKRDRERAGVVGTGSLARADHQRRRRGAPAGHARPSRWGAAADRRARSQDQEARAVSGCAGRWPRCRAAKPHGRPQGGSEELRTIASAAPCRPVARGLVRAEDSRTTFACSDGSRCSTSESRTAPTRPRSRALLADTGNEVFLLVANRRSHRAPDHAHPLGFGREAYVWSLLAALGLFVAGAAVSVTHGIQELITPEPATDFVVGYVVLALSFVLEGISFLRSARQARPTAELFVVT